MSLYVHEGTRGLAPLSNMYMRERGACPLVYSRAPFQRYALER
jgi:hypothetical protein